MTRALVEADEAGWTPPTIKGRDGEDKDESEGEDGEDLGQNPIPPSPGLLVDVADFTRRAEHPARSAGKKRRTGISSALRKTESAPAVNATSFVLAPALAAADPEILRRLDEMYSALGRIEFEVGRLATEVTRSPRLVGDRDEGDS